MPVAQSVSFHVLTGPSLGYLQELEVSARRSVGLFPHSDKSLPPPSPGSECSSLGRFLFVS